MIGFDRKLLCRSGSAPQNQQGIPRCYPCGTIYIGGTPGRGGQFHPTGGGLQHIVKPLGSAGSADPLNQRGTVGWKATKVAERLVEAYMIRVETASTFNDAPIN